MKKIIYIILYSILLISVGIGCKDKDDDPGIVANGTTQLTLNFEAMIGGDTLNSDSTYKDYADRDLQVSLLQYYITNIDLVDAEQKLVNIEQAAFIDHSFGDHSVTIDVTPGQYYGINFGLGLDPILNNVDPTSYEKGNPLGNLNNYWGWTKYRFLMIEGIVDSLGKPIIFGYHTGLDSMYRPLEFEHSFFVNEGSTTTLNFEIDINEIFTKTDTVNYLNVGDRSWHGETYNSIIATILSDNAAASMVLVK